MKIANRMEKLAPSLTLSITALANELKAHFATKSELAELTKAMATTDDADVMITVDYDA